MNERVGRREFLGAAVLAAVSPPTATAVQRSPVHARRLMERAIGESDWTWEFQVNAAWPTVIALFTEVIGIQPENQLALFYRGKAYSWSGSYERAAADFAQAMRLQPGYESGLDWSYSHRAMCAFDGQMGSRQAALRHWHQIIIRRVARAKPKQPPEV